MMDYMENRHGVSIYGTNGYAGYADANYYSYDFCDITGSIYGYGYPDGFGGSVFNGSHMGYTMPNCLGGQDVYTENGYETTLMPFLDYKDGME